MLKFKLFKWIAGLVLVFGILSIILGTWMIQSRVVNEAQIRVHYDLSSAWAVYNAKLRQLEAITGLTAQREPLVDACQSALEDEESIAHLQKIQDLLARICLDYQLDYMTLLAPDGKVLARASAPFARGDYRNSCPLVAKALSGQSNSGTVLLSQEQLKLEASGLEERSFFSLQKTPHDRPTPRLDEDRGMVMMAASPIMSNGKVLGAVYAGSLLNRNTQFVDQIRNIVFGNETYNGVPVGTVTVFLADTRIATTVRLADGNRAMGTRVSKQVADRVLDNDQSWADRAFVVKEWYLTAYDPIRDNNGNVIGMLYVGTLEAPFRDQKVMMIWQYTILLAAALCAAVVVAMYIAGRLAKPLHRLAESANAMRHGQEFQPVPHDHSCSETAGLIQAFNEMAITLSQREHELTDANEHLGTANESLKALNAHYMETLQFVSHELNSPISSITNYAYLLNEKLLGPLTDKQSEAMEVVLANIKRITEMTRHYLNLARIERGEIQPTYSEVSVRKEVIDPVLTSLKGDIQSRNMHVEDLIDPKILLRADLNMLREVFENLLSNAVKYGRQGGRIMLNSKFADDGMVNFIVRNEGEGIPPDHIGELFQKFSRIELGQSRQTSRGTGLGLFICKQIIEAHGGQISARSEMGEWTEFSFTLPSVKVAIKNRDGADN